MKYIAGILLLIAAYLAAPLVMNLADDDEAASEWNYYQSISDR